MHLAPIFVSIVCSLAAVAASTSSLWMISARRNRGRKVVEARLASLGETVVEIGNRPFDGASGETSGLTAGAIIHRVVSRTTAGEKRVREWAYDPAAASGLKTFAHGIWIPVA